MHISRKKGEKEMKTNIMLLNVLAYEKKDTGKNGTRLGLIFTEKESLQDTDKFKGFSEISLYYDGHEVFNKIPLNWIGRPITAYIKEVTNPSNPMRKKQVISCLEYENNSIDLL